MTLRSVYLKSTLYADFECVSRMTDGRQTSKYKDANLDANICNGCMNKICGSTTDSTNLKGDIDGKLRTHRQHVQTYEYEYIAFNISEVYCEKSLFPITIDVC